MHYPVPNALTIGDFEIGWNRVLSATDKEFIGTMYPRPKDVTELRTAQAVTASIGEHGEEDKYTFKITRRRKATLLTGGNTDVVMSLFGPDDETSLLAWDDDSGEGLNAHIQRLLQSGQYWVRVRHWHPRGIGDYQIELRLGA